MITLLVFDRNGLCGDGIIQSVAQVLALLLTVFQKKCLIECLDFFAGLDQGVLYFGQIGQRIHILDECGAIYRKQACRIVVFLVAYQIVYIQKYLATQGFGKIGIATGIGLVVVLNRLFVFTLLK